MYLLDADVLTLYLQHADQHPALVSRIQSLRPERVRVSVVAAQEVIQGAFNLIRQNQQTGKSTTGYRLLASLLQDLAFAILPFDDAANAVYNTLPAAVKRVGANDCRIAASALVHGYSVVTRNTRHFGQIPGVRFEDWTLPETAPL